MVCVAAGESSTLSNLLLVAGTVVTSLSCLEDLFVQVVANHMAATHEAAVIRSLLELNAESDTFQLPIPGIMIAAASWLGWRVQALPPWLGWVGAVDALLLGVASGNSLFPGEALPLVLDISAPGLLVWTAAVSVMMGWRSRAVRAGGGLAPLSRAVTDTSSSDAQIKSSQSN
jgi:hypothetical protein